jgi:drug/metabolite transporter (DMT)-like permease
VAILLALVASVGWGGSDFLGGLRSRSFSVLAVQAIALVAGFAVVVPVLAVRGEGPPGALSLLYGALAGVVGAIGLAAFYRALAVGAMGIVGPISATAPAVPVAIGLARGERPSGIQLAGIAVALVAIVLVGREPADRTRRLALGAGLALFAAVCFGASLFGIAQASKGDPYWSTLMLRVGGLAAMGVALGAVRPPVRGALRSWWAIAPIGLLDSSATILYSVATTRGLLSVVSVLASLYPITIVFLARTVLDERLAPVQLVGAAGALAGAALMSTG